MREAHRYCPRCSSTLEPRLAGGRERPGCPSCGFVDWGNPTPVVAAIVEHEGLVILARGRGWPEKMYALVTGFLEADETPQEGVLREVKEELNLEARVESLVGVYPFQPRNEVILAFHVTATGSIQLSEELEAYKALPPERVRPWALGTGLAVRDWLQARGLGPGA